MKELPLTQGKVALVDDEDYEWLNKWKWYAANIGGLWYAYRGAQTPKGQRALGMHRVIYSKYCTLDKRKMIDHIDSNGLNNRKLNLRMCTSSQNQMNRNGIKNSSSKYKGVGWHSKVNSWAARIKHKGKMYNLGHFKNENEAAETYNKAAKKYFGEFARLNKTRSMG